MVTLRNFHIGPIHICLGHNTTIDLTHIPFRTVHFDRIGRQIFFTLRIGQRFFNLDIV